MHFLVLQNRKRNSDNMKELNKTHNYCIINMTVVFLILKLRNLLETQGV